MNLAKEKKRATDKLKLLQQKIQVMSTQKVDLANKVMHFAELNIDQILKSKSSASAAQQASGAKAKREAK